MTKQQQKNKIEQQNIIPSGPEAALGFAFFDLNNSLRRIQETLREYNVNTRDELESLAKMKNKIDEIIDEHVEDWNTKTLDNS